MLMSSLGVVSALAFVLGLAALCLWLLKRFSPRTLTSRTRLPIEIVQRVALTPKMGLAVVRIGERVVAVSTGEGGVHALFDVDEADRQRVLSTSTVPTPMVSSAAASGAFATNALAAIRPGSFGRVFSRTLEQQVEQQVETLALEAPMVASPAIRRAPEVDFIEELRSMTDEVLATRAGSPLTYARSTTAPAGPDREFRALLGSALGHATTLAVFVGAMVVAQATATPARAQTAPPTPPAAVPVAPRAPSLSLPPAAQRTVQPSRTATPAQVGAPVRAPAARTGNGASITPGGAASTRPMSAMQLDSTKSAPGTPAGAATPAPIAADDAIMRMMPQMDVQLGNGADGGLRLNGTVGIVVMMGLLTLLPTLLLMMTGFTRILIVLHFLKQAMGTQTAPPAQLLAALALLLTGFVMSHADGDESRCDCPVARRQDHTGGDAQNGCQTDAGLHAATDEGVGHSDIHRDESFAAPANRGGHPAACADVGVRLQ